MNFGPTSIPPVPVAPGDEATVARMRRFAGGGVRRVAQSAGIVIEAGEGSYIRDTSGRRYLDLACAMGVAAFGHSHPSLRAALREQVDRICAVPLFTAEGARYLEALADFLPDGLDAIALFSSGAEAVEAALRLVRNATGRGSVISFQGAFHGKTSGTRVLGAVEAGGADETSGLVFEYPICDQHGPMTYEACIDDGERVLRRLAGRGAEVAAVIIEPVLGTAGNLPPERRFIRSLRTLCDEKGWLLVMDESITGFGRLGVPFAAGYFGVRPDVMVLGKAMGGGFPVSGVAASRELWRAGGLDAPSSTSSSCGGNPAACAAGLAVLRLLRQPETWQAIREASAVWRDGLERLARSAPRVRRPRGVGLMLGFDIWDDDEDQLGSSAACLGVFRRCMESGVFMLCDVPRVRLYPALNMGPVVAEHALALMSDALWSA
jgi:4-aminobutyrate aminotransferase-like enzyme